MFRALMTYTPPAVAQGYAVNNGKLHSRISAGGAADATSMYMGHVDIPAGALTGLQTDWHASIKVLYEAGPYGGVDVDAVPTGTTNSVRRFHVRLSTVDGSDPTNPNNYIGVSDPAEANTNRGGQFSVDLSAVAGTFGSEVRVTNSFNTQSDFLQHSQPLSRWRDSYGVGGLRVGIFFNWETPYPANEIMKVVSTCVSLIPGAATPLVTAAAPRTMTLEHFGLHWNYWPTSATVAGAAPALATVYGTTRSLDTDQNNIVGGTGISWDGIERVNWLPLTSAQRQARSEWALLDHFVAKHTGKRRVITLHQMCRLHTSNGSLNKAPADLADNTTGSWYIFCREVGLRYAGQGHFYEIFNEPFQTVSSGAFVNFGSATTTFLGMDATPAEMSTMIVQAAAAIRAVDPSAKIVGPGFLNLMDRGAELGYTYAKAILTANGNAAANTLDYFGYHAYPLNINGQAPGPLEATTYTKAIRRIATAAGHPTKPLLLTEDSSVNMNYAAIPEAARLAFMLRSYVGALLADPYQAGVIWYGLDNGSLGWTQADADAYNSMATFMTSGPITSAVINQDGTITVTANGMSRVF